MSSPDQCPHNVLGFGSGGWYVICQQCQHFWAPESRDSFYGKVGTSDPQGLRVAPNPRVEHIRDLIVPLEDGYVLDLTPGVSGSVFLTYQIDYFVTLEKQIWDKKITVPGGGDYHLVSYGNQIYRIVELSFNAGPPPTGCLHLKPLGPVLLDLLDTQYALLKTGDPEPTQEKFFTLKSTIEAGPEMINRFKKGVQDEQPSQPHADDPGSDQQSGE